MLAVSLEGQEQRQAMWNWQDLATDQSWGMRKKYAQNDFVSFKPRQMVKSLRNGGTGREKLPSSPRAPLGEGFGHMQVIN